jgi:hypothetical protein
MIPDLPARRGAAAALVPLPVPTAVVAAHPPSPPTIFARPAMAFGVMAAVGAGLYAGTLLVAVGIVLAMLGLVSLRGVRRACRRGLDSHLERKQRNERRRGRERRLEDAGVSREALAELSVLADEIERRDAALWRRHEVDDLLDRHVELTLVHERCLRAMRMCDRDQLSRARCEHASRPGGSKRRADMFDRRIRYWDQCKEQADRCDEELAVLGDLVRLLAQRAMCPASLVDNDLIERRLGDLDDEESAMHQVAMIGNG